MKTMMQKYGERSSLTRFSWLSIAAAIVTIALKTGAYLLTGSVSLLSDALESVVNLVGAIMALEMLTIAARPVDEDHAYGHGKAEYFSSGVEGTLILIAAVSICVAAVPRLITPVPITRIGLGVVVSIGASLVNLFVGMVLLRAGRRYDSITLEADANHLMTDVLTSAGVIIGIGAVALTGWERLDPMIALLVAANIIGSGFRIIRKSVMGLMDTAIPAVEQEAVQRVIEPYRQNGIEFHALRTRQSGVRRFVSVHVLVPGEWTVERGHHLLENLDADIRRALPSATVFTHLEPLDDPASLEDVDLDRREPSSSSSDRNTGKVPAKASESGTG